MRQFHCWQLVGTIGMEADDDDNENKWDIQYSITANLTGLNPEMNTVQNSVLRSAAALSSSRFEF
jgi:hypothetical protein